jgi:hypothetical protein
MVKQVQTDKGESIEVCSGLLLFLLDNYALSLLSIEKKKKEGFSE